MRVLDHSVVARPILAAAAAVCVLFGMPALACIHAPLLHKGVVKERLKEAFMFHDGELAHLVLRTTLRGEGGLPDSMAWVIPLPSLPKLMEEAGEGIFGELFSLTIPPPPPPPRDSRPGVKAEAPKAEAAAPAIKVHAVTIAGDYRLQPIEILSDAAGEELNAWLTQNEFGPVPPENQRFYLKKGAVFLAVKLGALKGAQAELKPLHFAYPAERPTLPLKFSTHSGEFDVTLYTFTPERPAKDALAAFHLEYVHAAEVRGADLEARAPDLHKLLGKRTGWLTRFHAVSYNIAGRMVAELKADPAFGAAMPVTRTAMSSESVELLEWIGMFVLLATGITGLTYWRRRKQGKPWRVRTVVYLVLFAVAYVFWFTTVDAYANYLKRNMVRGSLDMTNLIKAEIAEKAREKRTLVGVGAETRTREGYSVSRDGVIRFELDPSALGVRLKFVLTPDMKGGEVHWICEAYPQASARRFAPASCRRPG